MSGNAERADSVCRCGRRFDEHHGFEGHSPAVAAATAREHAQVAHGDIWGKPCPRAQCPACDRIERAILDAEQAERAACLAALDAEIAKHPQPEHMFTLAARAAAASIRAREGGS
jgi:hypothetical protein